MFFQLQSPVKKSRCITASKRVSLLSVTLKITGRVCGEEEDIVERERSEHRTTGNVWLPAENHFQGNTSLVYLYVCQIYSG